MTGHKAAAREERDVKGQDEVLSGGLVTSLLADTRNPC